MSVLGFKIHLQRFLVYSYFRYIRIIRILQQCELTGEGQFPITKTSPCNIQRFFPVKGENSIGKKNIILLLLFLLNTLIVEFLSRSGAKIQIK